MSAISTIDTLAHTNGWVGHHMVDKLVWAGGLVVVALVVPVSPGAPLVLGAVVASCSFARIPMRDLFVVVRIPFGFIAAGAAATAISLRVSGGLSIGVGDWKPALELAARSIAGTSAAVLVAMTVPVSELLARSRRIGVPAVACEVALLMYRMIAVGLHRMRWQRLAQESRLGYVGFRRSVRSAAGLALASLIGSVSHAQRLSIGLGARNFDGTLPVLDDGSRHSVRFLSASGVSLIAIVTASWLIGHTR